MRTRPLCEVDLPTNPVFMRRSSACTVGLCATMIPMTSRWRDGHEAAGAETRTALRAIVATSFGSGTALRGIVVALALGTGATAWADRYVQFPGADCTTPAYLHCPAENCGLDRLINPGPVVEMKTRRTYFLDYPC